MINLGLNSDKYKAESLKEQHFDEIEMEMIVQNIDNQLQRAYIKQNKKIRSPLHKNYLKYVRFQQKQQINYNKQETPQTKQYKNALKSEEITLINNKDVMKYIKYIYSHYNIQDPAPPKKENQTRLNINFNSTNKKLGDYQGDQTIDSSININSARTVKTNEKIDKVNVSPFLSHYQQNNKTQRTTRKVILLKSKNKKRQQNNFLSQEKLKKNQQNNLNNQQILQKTSAKLQNKIQKISQTFRYCFMCQLPILEHNLSFHENQCPQLKNAYNFTLKQLINTLDQKIKKHINAVKNNFTKQSNEQILEQSIKDQQLISKWINEVIHNLKSDTYCKMQDQSKQKRLYKMIQITILTKMTSKLQSINKLEWFLKLKNNLKAKYYNNQ